MNPLETKFFIFINKNLINIYRENKNELEGIER